MLLLVSAAASAQNPFWLLQNNTPQGGAPSYPWLNNYDVIRFNSSGLNTITVTPTTIDPYAQSFAGFVANAYFDKAEKPLFWYDQSGAPFGYTFQGAIAAGPPFYGQFDDVVLLPAQPLGNSSDCRAYLAVAFTTTTSGGGTCPLQAQVIAPKGFTSQSNSFAANPPTYPGTPGVVSDGTVFGVGMSGKVAAARPNAAGRQFVYVAVNDPSPTTSQSGIWVFESIGQRTDAVVSLPSLSTTLTTTAGAATPFGQAKIFSSASGGTYKTNELEISADGSKIAWADATSNKVYLATLNPATGKNNGTVITPATITSLSVQKINGLEFAPGSNTVVYAAAGADGPTTDGVFRIDFGPAIPTVTRVNGPNNTQIANSYLEADYTGSINALATTAIISINPAPTTNATFRSRAHTYPTRAGTPAGPRRLPRQIDGWHYNYGAALTGPRIVQVSGVGAAPTQTYTASPVPGASYSFCMRRTSAGNCLCTQGPSTSNTFTCTLTGDAGEVVMLEVSCTTAGPCPVASVNTLAITLDDGTLPQRPAPPTDVYPNPATEQVTIVVAEPEALDRQVVVRNLGGEEQCRISVRTGQRRVVVPVQTWPAGVYVVSITTPAGTVTRPLAITREQP